MARARHKDALQIDEGLEHQRREWRAERIGWAIMALLLLAAALGLFGYGPMSHVHGGDLRALSVEYDRLQRSSAPSELQVHADGSLVPHGELRLRFDQALIDGMELDSIVPEPERVFASRNGTEFVFNVARNSDAQVMFRFRPATFGRRTGRVSVPGAPAVILDQFIYP